MRTLLFLISSVLVISTSAQVVYKNSFPQKNEKQLFERFGFKAGYNRSDVTGKESDGDKIGYIGGELYAAFFAEAVLTDRFKLQPEILFSWTDDYHFIEIPVHFQYSIYRKWIIFVGPKFDFLVDAGIVEPASPHKAIGISADAGVQFNFNRRLFAEMRYSKGFSRQVNNISLDINDAKRNTSRIGLGIRF